MKKGPENPEHIQLIALCEKKMRKEKKPVYTLLLKYLRRPRRRKVEVNVKKLEVFSKDKELIIVPGKVLGIGELKKPIKVAALSFSSSAIEKIKRSKGEYFYLLDLFKSNKKLENVRVII